MSESIATAGRVVVGTDGSPAAAHAVDWAAEVASKRGKALLILAAAHAAPAASATEVERVRSAHPDLEVEYVATDEEPAAALIAATADAELVVVGARGVGRAGVRAWRRGHAVGAYGEPAPLLRMRALGGISDQVVTHAEGQVMVVPEVSGFRDGPVVVGVDDSPEAVEAVRAAFGAAVRTGQPLLAVHTVSASLGAAASRAAASISLDEVLKPLDDRVDEILAPFAAAHPDVKLTKEVSWGHPVEALAEASKTAHIVVVGSRGHGGFAGLLLGSTCRGLLRHSAAPVMVLRRGLSAADSE